MNILLLYVVAALLWVGGHGKMCDFGHGSTCQAGVDHHSGLCLDYNICQCEPMAVPDNNFVCHVSDIPTVTVVKPILWNGEALVRGTLVLMCNSIHQQADIVWYKNGSRMNDVTNHQLVLQDIQESDDAMYQCSTSMFGKEGAKSTEMHVKVLTSLRSLSKRPLVLGMPEKAALGAKIHLRCVHIAATAATSFKWLVDGDLVNPSSKIEDDMWITMDESWLGKEIGCEMDVVQYPLARRIFSDVVRTPGQLHDNFDSVAVYGNLMYKEEEALYLTCATPDDFAPSENTRYLWLREDMEIIPNSNHRVLKMKGSDMSGMYQCIASYSTVQRKSMPVKVIHGITKPSIKMVSPKHWNGETVWYGKISFTCELPNTGNKYSADWWKDGKHIHTTSPYSNLWTPSITSTSYYQCSVNNVTSDPIYIPVTSTVQQLPTVLGMPIYASPNSTLSLTCGTVPAVPKPNFIWNVGGKDLKGVTGQTVEIVMSSDNMLNTSVKCALYFKQATGLRLDNVLVSEVVNTPAEFTGGYPSPSLSGRLIYRQGENIRLECNLDKNYARPQGVEFWWKGPPGHIPLPDQREPVLYVWNSRKEHAGSYTCFVDYKDGPQISTASVQVYYDMVRSTEIKSNQEYWSGDVLPLTYLTLYCTPKMFGSGTYRWYKDGNLLPDKDTHSYTTNESGQFKCSLNYFGVWTEMNNPVQVNVLKEIMDLSKPIFVLGMQQHMYPGQEFTLVCANLPKGDKTLKWFVNNEEMADYRGLLKIQDKYSVQWAGQKVYCMVEIVYDEGVHGMFSNPVQFPKFNSISTTRPDKWPTTEKPVYTPRIVIKGAQGPYEEGSSVKLFCDTLSHTDTAYYAWSKDGDTIAHTNSNYYTLYSVLTSDSGTYTCTLKLYNRVLVSWNSVYINVRGDDYLTTRRWEDKTTSLSPLPRPRISILEGYDGAIMEGAGVTLTCHSNILFTPIEWTKNGQFLIRKYGLYYKMYSVIPDDSGAYACRIRYNDRLYTSNTIYITVLDDGYDPGEQYDSAVSTASFSCLLVLAMAVIRALT